MSKSLPIMALPQSVAVSVESVLENQIQEVTFDGQEIHVPSLSMSENLAKLAHRIDFTTEKKDESSETEEKQLVKFQPSLWPWDSVRNRLKAAHTEMSVLLDVLNIAKEKKYMVLDPVSAEPADSKQAVTLLSKRKSLSSAAQILMSGHDKLRQSHLEMAANISQQQDFHLELLRLRQTWRLKKVGKSIVGDLSYKSAGSRFWQSGTFEVTKNVDELSSEPGSSTSALKVIIPSQLEGEAYIQVSLRKTPDSCDISSAIITLPSNVPSISEDAHWQHKLEAAQNVLYCKELFAQLAREAVKLKSNTLVCGNQIIVELFPRLQLFIALCHYTCRETKSTGLPPDLKHDHVLEHSLHQMLRDIHYKNIHPAMPQPITATLGMSRKRRLAGPCGHSASEMLTTLTSETCLERIIQQAKHCALRSEVFELLDNMAAQVPDPQLTIHCNSLTGCLECTVRVDITTAGWDHSSTRISFSVNIGHDGLTVICKDGRSVRLSYEVEELRSFILSQIAQHQANISQIMCKLLGWHILACNSQCGSGEMDPRGNVSTVLMASHKGERVVSVKCSPTNGIQVAVQCCEQGNSHKSKLVTNPKWKYVSADFKPVDLSQMEGKTYANKLEFIMTSFTS